MSETRVDQLKETLKILDDQLRNVLQQLGMHYSNREKSQRSIDQLEGQLDVLKLEMQKSQAQLAKIQSVNAEMQDKD